LRSDARKHGLFELLDELPPEAGEPPVDSGACEVRTVYFYNDSRFRVSYHPNDLRYPFVIAEWEGRDGCIQQHYGSSHWDELNEQLQRFGLQWLAPLIDSWMAHRPMPLTAVLALYRRHRGEAPLMETFEARWE